MRFWEEIFGTTRPEPAVEIMPPGPTLYDAQIPDAFNLGWYYSENKNQIQMAKISNRDRDSHFYCIGGTGVGKSKFLQYLIMQDIFEGRGVGVIDPHGDLIDDLKGLLTVGYVSRDMEAAISDSIILIDPTDPTYTVSFNPLEKLPNISAAEQANELVASFRKIWADSWGVRMEDLMRNSLIALCEAELTLVELAPFLTNRGFREGVLEKVKNPVARDYFQRFNTITDKAAVSWIEPIMNKVNAVFADERIRAMFSAPQSSFNFREAMDAGKVILIKLDKGRLKDAANLLGALLVSKLQMAAFSRSDIPEKQRRPFYLYLDEFQNFANETFSVVLSEARKYKLFVTMAHQSLAQISSELRSLIFSCAGIQIFFQVSRDDASHLAKEAFHHDGGWEQSTSELQSLPLRSCYVRNKMQGGVIQIHTVALDTPWELARIGEDKFRTYMDALPFGQLYLVERQTLAAHEEERRGQFVQEAAESEVEAKPTRPPVRQYLSRPSESSNRLPAHNPAPAEIPRAQVEQAEGENGNSRHQYLQSLVKRLAEEKGYKATIEEPIPDGRVDVGLARNGKKVACEISVTNTPEYECGNIEKCFKAGYDQVLMCSQDKKHLQKIRVMANERLGALDLVKVLFLEPEELLLFLEEETAKESVKEERIKGYKVKVNYQAVTKEEKDRKRAAVAGVILGAFKRLKGKG